MIQREVNRELRSLLKKTYTSTRALWRSIGRVKSGLPARVRRVGIDFLKLFSAKPVVNTRVSIWNFDGWNLVDSNCLGGSSVFMFCGVNDSTRVTVQATASILNSSSRIFRYKARQRT